MAGLKIFVSYTSADRDWAHWIAWTLREAGHEPFVHEWEIGPGDHGHPEAVCGAYEHPGHHH
jgi:hypothetical protein